MDVDASPEVVGRVQAKLQQFVESLTAEERAVFDSIIDELSAGEVSGYAFSGIDALISITQIKVDSANDDAIKQPTTTPSTPKKPPK